MADIVPIGYYFRPTDEDLVVGYLNPRNRGAALPSNAIEFVNVWVHVDENKLVRYVFTTLVRISTRVSRQAGDGVWNTVTGARTVLDNAQRVVGYKRTFVFELNSIQPDPSIPLGRWTMIEYGEQVGEVNVIGVLQVDRTQHTKTNINGKSKEVGDNSGGSKGGPSKRGGHEGGPSKRLKVS
ncbi:NAC domain-containing protein 41-like [Apium graveolens]|uniref:NAC domain-containing protein 41-like n=1 Tax=Apium graveolens TaxID=4045 RepID=UPI003D78C7E4